MIHSLDRASPLPRSQSLECLQACFGAHAAHSRTAPHQVDAIVRRQVDRFVHGSPQEAVACGTRLLRRVIETGIRDPSSAASTWFATLSRMEQLTPAFALARRIAAFRAEQSDHVDATLDVIYRRLLQEAPEQVDAIISAQRSMGSLLRSIDWAGWTAACLVALHTLEQLTALEALVAHPSYATALACSRHGAITGRQRLDAGADLDTIDFSDAALRMVKLLGCEEVTVRMALSDNPQQDPVATRLMFQLVYAPAIAEQLDAALSAEALESLATKLATPAVQQAFEAETTALPKSQKQTTKLLQAAIEAHVAPAENGRCQ
jgi:hypothetical protein